MPFDYCPSSANPGLLILLTDELEESVKVVNRLIDSQIQVHFDGDTPKNRWFIVVFGYNGRAKELVSGWLRDLDASPLRFESEQRKITDIAGGLVMVDVKNGIWVEQADEHSYNDSYTDLFKLVTELCKVWSEEHVMPPIIIDISAKCHVECAIKEIEQLKNISTTAGSSLFLGCYPDQYAQNSIFSEVPNEMKCRFRRDGINENDYIHGILNRDKIYYLLDSVSTPHRKSCGTIYED